MTRKLSLGRSVLVAATAALIAGLVTIVSPGVSSASPQLETVSWSPQSAVPGAGTSAVPAMTTCGGVTWMVWKGSGTDTRLFFSYLDPEENWVPQQVLGGGALTSTGPAVACAPGDGHVTVVWKGASTDDLYYTFGGLNQDGSASWATQRQVQGGAQTDVSPSIAILPGGQEYLAWKGAGSDTSAHIDWLNPTNNNEWQPAGFGIVPGVSLDSAPTLTIGLSLPYYDGAAQVSLLWKVYNGANMYFATMSGAPTAPSWTSPALLGGGGGTSASPEATFGPGSGTSEFGTPLVNQFVAWKGIPGDDRIFYTINHQDGAGWQPQQLILGTGTTTNGLAVADQDHYTGCGVNAVCETASAYIAWEGPNQQITYIHGTY